MAHKVHKITLDNTEFKNKLRETQQMVARINAIMKRDLQIRIGTSESTNQIAQAQSNVTRETKRTGDEIRRNIQHTDTFSKTIIKYGAGFFSLRMAKDFAGALMGIRGEFQQLEIAFNTMLRNKEKSDALMRQLTETAAKTPFDLQGVTQGAKQLLAYGVEADKLNEKLITLGDISAGLSLPLGDLVYLYGTTMTQGRMYTRDLIQFMGRGIPLAEELAKQFGVTKDKVQELVSAGKVGAKEFDKAIEGMRLDRFNNLMAAQSKSITGQISNLGDSFQMMMNEIGKNSEGAINKALQGAGYLIEHYEDVGRTLAMLVATYGVYRTALIANAAAQAITSKGLAAYIRSIRMATGVQTAFNAVIRANPYVLATSAILTLVSAMLIFRDTTTASEKALKSHNEEVKKQNEHIAEQEKLTNDAIAVLKDENATRLAQSEAVKLMQTLYPGLFANLDTETAKMRILNTEVKRYAELREGTLLDDKKKSVADIEAEIKKKKREYDNATLSEDNGSITFLTKELRKLHAQLGFAKKDLDEYQRKLKEANMTPEQKRSRAEYTLFGLKAERERLVAEQERQMKLADRFTGVVDPLLQTRIEITDKSIQKVTQSLREMGEVKPTNSLATEIQNANKELAEQQKYLSELRSGQVKGLSDYASEIENTEKRIKELNGTIKTLTGIDRAEKPTKSSGKSNVDKLVEERARFENQVREQGAKGAQALILSGIEDEIEQIEERYNLTISSIVEQKKEYMREFNATQVQANALFLKQEQNASTEYEQAMSAHYKSLEEKYATYQQQLDKIRTDAERDRQAFRSRQRETNVDMSANIAEVDKQEKEATDALNLAFAMKKEEFESWTNKVSDMALEVLENMLRDAQALLSTMKDDGADPEKIAIQMAKISTLEKRIREHRGKNNGSRTLKEWQDLYKVLNDVSGSFREIGENMGGMAGEMIKSAGVMSTQVLSMISGIVELANWSVRATEMTAKGVSKSIQAVEKASVILAVVSAVIQAVQTVSRLISSLTDDKEEKEAQKFRYEMDALNASLSVTKLRAEEAGKALKIFSGNEYGNAVSSIHIAEASLDRYNKVLKGFVSDNQNKDNLLKFLFGYTDLSKFESDAQKFGAILGDISITTKEAKKFLFFNWGGESKRLKDLVPELFNPDQSIDMNALDKFIGSSTYEKLSDKAKQALTELQKSHQEYKESLKEVEGYLSNVFGHLGGSVMDKLVEDLRSGEDAVRNFREAVAGEMSKLLEDMTKKMVFSAVFASLFKDAEGQMMEMMKRGAGEGEYIDFFANFLKSVTASREEATNMLNMIKKAGENQGFDMFNGGADDPRSGNSKGIAQASQDSIDELVGLWHTSMQISSRTESTVTAYAQAMQALQVKGWQEVTVIRELTEKIERNTASIDTNIKDVNAFGVKVKGL